jgi:citrate synthase
MNNDLHWHTLITKVEPNNVVVRGYPIQDLMGKIGYTAGLYLVLKGELPDENTRKMLEALLVSSLDHGASPPSTLAARTVASTGSTLNAALAAGVLSINQFHGGAIENAMISFQNIKKIMEDSGKNEKDAAMEYVRQKNKMKEKLFGYGHRLHTDDPRQKKLYQMARELGFEGVYVRISLAVKESLKETTGKDLPVNVDGAIAAILSELDFPPILANAFFIIARLPGLLAHIYEEQTEFKPMRKIHPTDYEYTGVVERKLDK